LLGQDVNSNAFSDGALVIFRLAPQVFVEILPYYIVS
jgi:hypothetical protein